MERGGEAMNKRARRSANYDRRLARPIKLADGTWLKTIKDAADFFAKDFFFIKKKKNIYRAADHRRRERQARRCRSRDRAG